MLETNIIINTFLFLACMADFVLGFIVIKKGKDKESSIVFGVTCICVALWTLGIAAFRLINNLSTALFWNREFIFTAGIIPTTFLHFSFAFTNRNISFIKKALIYLPNIIILISIFLPNVLIKNIIIQPWGKESILGYGYPLYGLFFTLFMAAVYFNLLKAYFSAKGIFKLRILLIFLAISISVLFGSFFNLYLILVGNYKYIWVGPYASFVFVVITTFAITKHRLMNITVVVSRAIAETLTILFLGSIYLGSALLYTSYISPKVDLFFIVWTILYGIIVGQVYQKIRLFLQTTTNKTFIQGWYESDKVLKSIAEKLTPVLSIENTTKIIGEELKKHLEIDNVTIISPLKKSTTVIDKYKILNNGEFLPMQHPFIQYFTEFPELTLLKELPIEIQEAINISINPKAILVLPLSSPQNLETFILLGPKASEDAYNQKDFTLLETIKNQAHVILDRVQSYEKMRQDLSVEREKVQVASKDMEKTHRLTSLGIIAAGLAHEIRNPMMVLSSQSQLLPKKIKDKDEEFLLWYSKMIPGEINKILDLIKHTLKLARAKEENEQIIDIQHLLEDTLALLGSRFKEKNIKAVKEFNEPGQILGNYNVFSEALLNIILNAVDFTKNKGTITIRAFKENNHSIIQVADTGVGIPKEKLEYIFDPFFTTRAEGMGLGLSIAYNIIKEMGGEIKVASEIGKGTTFTISLPTSTS